MPLVRFEMDLQPIPPAQDASRHGGRCAWRLLKALPQLFRQASREWNDDNVPRLGAAVAFYTLLSLAPTVVLAIALAAVFYGKVAAQGRLATQIQGMAGPDVARAIQEIVLRAYQPRTGLIAASLSLATLIFSASSVFVELHDAVNTIWKVPPPLDRNTAATVIRLIKDRFYSFVAVLCIGLLLLISLVLNAWIAATRLAVPPPVAFLVLYLVTAVLFAVLYKIVPDVRLKWRDIVPGAMITALFLVFGKQILWLYFKHTSFGSTYSAAGSLIVVLLWVYYSAQLLFWGAEFIKVYTKTLGSHADPFDPLRTKA